MREYDIITEVKNPEKILNQYHYTTALDIFIITITKEEHTKGKGKTETQYNAYISRKNYGNIHFVVGIPELDFITLKDAAIDYIQHLEIEIAEGKTDC